MPTFVIVLIIIAGVIFLILKSRVKFYAYYSEKIEVSIRYLFFKFNAKKPQEGQTDNEKQAVEKQSEQPQKVTLEQLRSFLDTIGQFWDEFIGQISKFKEKFRIDKLNLELVIGGGDAAETAITYGQACAVVFPVISLLERIIKIKKKKILVNANFNGDGSIVFEITASISIGALITAGAANTVKILLTLIKNPIKFGQRGMQNE